MTTPVNQTSYNTQANKDAEQMMQGMQSIKIAAAILDL
jgi:hypothetical protein